jgi:hypothetical protein
MNISLRKQWRNVQSKAQNVATQVAVSNPSVGEHVAA